jgi:hypothetical protein
MNIFMEWVLPILLTLLTILLLGVVIFAIKYLWLTSHDSDF